MENSSSLLKTLLSKYWWLLFLLAALEAGNSEYGEFALLTFRDTQSFPLGGVGFLLSMIMSFVLPLLLLGALIQLIESSRKPPAEPMGAGLWQLIIENMRVYGWVFLSFFAFIIPGLINYVRYSLVPFVVFLEPEYQNDKIDALKYSKALTEGHFWRLSGVIILGLIAPIIPWLVFGELKFREQFAMASMALVFTFLIEVFCFVVMYRIYLVAREAKPATSEG